MSEPEFPLPKVWEPAAFQAELEQSALKAHETGADWLIVQVTTAARFEQIHLPGAQLVQPEELMAGTFPAPGKLPELAHLTALFQRLGHVPGRPVIALDDEGGGWAGRLLWTLDCLGERRWHYLNGGLVAWANAGLPTAAGAAKPVTPSSWIPTLDLTALAQLDAVIDACTNGSVQIWDARSPEEHAGLRSGSQRAGHMPGARNLDWLNLMDPARDYRLPTDLADRISAAGIDLTQPVIAHCQTHHRSSLAYLCGRILGAADIKGYAGSWAEWGNHPDTPIVTSAHG